MKTILSLLVFVVLVPPTEVVAEPPNIVMVFIDDMGWGDFSCFGNQDAATPNIDRLANEGIRFEQFYVNSPICSPSRTAISTGQYPQRWRITSYLSNRKSNRQRGMAQWLDPQAPMLARFLQQAGYATGHFGKWHMGGQRDVDDAPPISEYGFDTSLTNFEGMGAKLLPLTLKPGQKEPGRIWSDAERLGEGFRWMQRSELTTGFVDAAIPFIDAAAEAGKPFYINLWPDDVHSPFWPPVENWGDGSKRRLYLSVLESMDRQLGRLFDRIRDDSNLRNNTLVLVCSDNGPELGAGEAGPFRGYKTHLYEGGVRSPLIAWGPGVVTQKQHVDRESVFCAIDLCPTLLKLTETAPADGVVFDGEALVGTLLGEGGSRAGPIFFRRPPDRDSFYGVDDLPDLAVRLGRWKFLCEYDGSTPELYDIETDRSESNNVASENRDVVAELTASLLDWHNAMPGDNGATYRKAAGKKIGINRSNPSGAAPEVQKQKNVVGDGKQPNIVVLLADDLGWNSVGYHNEEFQTPHIDSIARGGIQLNRFYSAPMCSPTRAGLMTGRYPIRFGLARAVIPPQRDFGLPKSESTIGKMLGKIGYRHRAVFGKWHLGHRRAKWHPLAQGFTHFHGHYNGAIDYFDLTRQETRDWHVDYEPATEQGYATDLIADAAAEWIETRAKLDFPYFCYVPFNAPHSPFQAPEDAIAKYGNPSGSEISSVKNRETYKAMVGRMDEGIGRILRAIELSGESENTVVWFFSDNGGVGGLQKLNHPLRGAKLSVYEGGIRVPACVCWPGRIKPGGTSDFTCGYIDVLPTLISMAGGNVAAAQPVDGIDLTELLDGQIEPANTRSWFSYHGQSGEDKEHLAVSNAGWKLKVNGPRLTSIEQLTDESRQIELFQLSVDPFEKSDVKSDHPELVRKLGKQLIQHRALQPTRAIAKYGVGKAGFVPPKNWRIDPAYPNKLIGQSTR